MNKKKQRINLAQNLIIALLTVSALALFSKTTLFSELSRTALAQHVQTVLSQSNQSGSAESSPLSSISVPLRIVQTNEFACHGADALTTSGEAFERVGSFLGEAIGSAYGMETAGQAEFLRALERSGLYFDFSSSLPVEVLAARLGVTADAAQSLNIRRCLLSIGSADTALLYLSTDSGKHLKYKTAVSVASLQSYLDTITGNETAFAFSLEEEYAALSPLTVVLGDPGKRYELSSANALGDFSTGELLRRAEFNAHTQNSYTESSGTVVVLEAQRMLRLEPDGTVLYTGNQTAEEASVYHVPMANGETPSRLEAVHAAQSLLSGLLHEHTGDALIYLRSIEPTAAGYRLSFDYMVDGTPVLFSDGSYAAEVSVEGDSITAFSLRLRRYTRNAETCLLLPLRQAAAIAGRYEQGELSVAYIDTFTDTTHAEWISG